MVGRVSGTPAKVQYHPAWEVAQMLTGGVSALSHATVHAGVLSVHLKALLCPAGKLRKYCMEKTLWLLLTFGNLLSLYCSFRVFFGKLFHPTIAHGFCRDRRSLGRSPTGEYSLGRQDW